MSWIIDDWDTVPERHRGRAITLLTLAELDALPKETRLVSVMGNEATVEELPDRDTCGGFSAWGVLSDE